MNDKTTTDADVQAMFDYIDSFDTVRLTTFNGKTTGIKIKTVDGKTEEYHTDYIVSAVEGQTLPVDGEYPLHLFEDVFIMADVYPVDYTGIKNKLTNNNYLDYVGVPEED